MLDLARTDLAAGAFAQAQSRADAVLRAGAPPSMRATALALAGDAAYGMGAYRAAADRYAEILRSDEVPAEAPHAALALGWAELRLGRREDARRTWIRVSRQFPGDPRAPTALVLAAELATQANESFVARTLLDRALEGYPASPDAEIARLSRAVLAMRGGHPQAAARDLRVLARSGRPALSDERRKLLDGLVSSEAQGGGAHQLLLTNRYEREPTAASTSEERRAGSDPNGSIARFAAPFLGAAGDPDTTPRVLHGLLLVATEDRAWSDVEVLSRHLIERFPTYTPGRELLAGVAAQASRDRQWPIARASYEHVIARSPSTALPTRAQIDFAEALLRTGDAPRARSELTRAVQAGPRAEDAPRALYLLAEVNEALDDPREALAAYDRLRREYPRAEWTADSLLPHARLLQHAIGHEQRARQLLEEVVHRGSGGERSEASFRLGQILAAAGDHRQAVDWYMSAAYASAEPSRWHRAALLGAGHSLTALKRTPAALVVYRSVLPSTPLASPPRDGDPMPELAAQVEEPKLAGEAAYRIGELLREAGRNEEAVDMYLTAASLASDTPKGAHALVGAVRSLVALGDRVSAEAISQRLVDAPGIEPELVAQAKKALQAPRPALSPGGKGMPRSRR